jgi:hypothetical protein
VIAAVCNVALAAGGKKSWGEALKSVLFGVVGCLGLGGVKGMLGSIKGLALFGKTASKAGGMAKFLKTAAVAGGKSFASGAKAAFSGLKTAFTKIKNLGSALKSLSRRFKQAIFPVKSESSYPVYYEMTLNREDWRCSRSIHFNRANKSLDNAMKRGPALAAKINKISPGASSRVSEVGGRKTPEGMTWHHAHPDTVGGRVGVMQLVKTEDHRTALWSAMHPGNKGGYSIWGPNGSMWNG